MTEERERELLRAIASLGSTEEAHGLREQISLQKETMTNAVMSALRERIDAMARLEGRIGL